MTRVGGLDTWWDVHGDGPPLVLLHPGGADSRAYDLNLPGLAETFRTYRFDRRGQGRTPDPGGPITFAAWPPTPSPSLRRSSAAPRT
jgi:pimeloyl-ACP methyl ester carboxylesterase